MQLDLGKYRQGWDTSTAQCREVDTDIVDTHASSDVDHVDTHVSSGGDQHSSGDDNNMVAAQNKSQAMVYYWEVQYPAFFSNRCSNCLDVVFSLSSLFS